MPTWIGADVFLPEVAAHEKPPANALDWRSWAKELGGCDASEATARVTLIGLAPVTVVVSTPVFHTSAGQLPDGFRAVRPVGGAEMRPRGIDVDLDTFGAENPIVNLGEESVDGPRMPSQWSLRQGDVEQFDLRAKLTTASIVTWSARIPLLIDGHRRFIEVSDSDGLSGSPAATGCPRSTGLATSGARCRRSINLRIRERQPRSRPGNAAPERKASYSTRTSGSICGR